MTVLRAVTYNLGCGGPHSAARVQAADDWAVAARIAGYDLLFVQELPSDSWLEAWRTTHQVFAVNSHGWKVRSALLVKHPLECSVLHFFTDGYHDSYVAAASVSFPDGRAVTCLSVHASPSRVTPEWRATWTATPEVLPIARDGEDLWDADLLLASVRALAPSGSLLVAGDWNEAREWDEDHPGSTAGAQFFELVKLAGLVDCTWSEWGEERATCVPERGSRAVQLDHIFATPDIAEGLVDARVVTLERVEGLSDHMPISFSFSTSAVA